MLNNIAFEMKIVVLKKAKLKLCKLITSLALEKCKKRVQYSLNYSGTRFLSSEN